LQQLITEAYDVLWVQLDGPSWLNAVNLLSADDKFDLEVRLPPETTMQQYRLMLQNLLAGRFGLKTHREIRQGAVYALVVNKAPKITPSPDVPPPADDAKIDFRARGDDGFPITPPGYSGMFVNVREQVHMKFMRQTMAEFAKWLWSQTKKPVVDRTGLESTYDFYVQIRKGTPSANPDASTNDDNG